METMYECNMDMYVCMFYAHAYSASELRIK